MIPKIIHYCWFGTKKRSPLEIECINTWKTYLPEYEIREWNESNFDFNSRTFTQEAYKAGKYAFVSDVCRLEALLNFGGLYFDTDIRVVKTFNPLLSLNKLVLGKEDENRISSACILSPAGNDILRKMLEYYDNKKFEIEGEYDMTPNTAIISNFLREQYKQKDLLISNEDLIVFPQDYFSPKNFSEKKYQITEKTFCIHLFNQSWRPFKVKLKEKIVQFLPKKVYSLWKRVK